MTTFVTDDSFMSMLYSGVYNRAPDQMGMVFWSGVLSQAKTTAERDSIVDQFIYPQTGIVMQPGQDSEQNNTDIDFVQWLYEAFHRSAGDQAGTDFWVQVLNSGVSRASVLANFLEATVNYDGSDAQALDRQNTLLNRAEVARLYVKQMGVLSNFPESFVGASFEDLQSTLAFQAAQAVLAGVTAADQSVRDARAKIVAAAKQQALDLLVKPEPKPEVVKPSPPTQPITLLSALKQYEKSLQMESEAGKILRSKVETIKQAFDSEVNAEQPLHDFVESVRESLVNRLSTTESLLEYAPEGSPEHIALLEEQMMYQGLQKQLDAAWSLYEKKVQNTEKAELGLDKFGYVRADMFGTAVGTEHSIDSKADLFVYHPEKLQRIDYFDAQDRLYLGEFAKELVIVSVTDEGVWEQTGNDALLEVFALQDDQNTILYIEKTSEAGSAPDWDTQSNVVSIVLTGVQADTLMLSQGFLTFS